MPQLRSQTSYKTHGGRRHWRLSPTPIRTTDAAALCPKLSRETSAASPDVDTGNLTKAIIEFTGAMDSGSVLTITVGITIGPETKSARG